jgi:hypothetical protein
MKLPNLDSAIVPESKIRGYLLAASHPQGRHKAAFFRKFGFLLNQPVIVATALVKHARENEVAKVEDSPFGRRYVIDGILEAPDGRAPVVRSVWFIKTGDSAPRFVTAYPLESVK